MYAALRPPRFDPGGAGWAVENPYRQWIDTYADPGFEALADRLEGLLDRYGSDVAALRFAYRRAMRLELAFFDAAYRCP